MAVLEAGVAVKDDLLRELGVTTDYAEVGSDAEDIFPFPKELSYQEKIQEIYKISRDLLSRNLITENEYNEFRAKSRDSKLVRDVLDDVVMIFVNDVVHEVRREMQAEKEQAERERAGSK
jgi:hypothetical protein